MFKLGILELWVEFMNIHEAYFSTMIIFQGKDQEGIGFGQMLRYEITTVFLFNFIDISDLFLDSADISRNVSYMYCYSAHY